MGPTGIEWTDATWNPVVGCTKVSPGCKHCYAKTLHDQRHKARLAGKRVPLQYAEPFEVVQLMPDRLAAPFSWRKPRKVFVNSVSDLFHEDVPEEYIARVFATMHANPRHTFQVLTKRADRMQAVLSKWGKCEHGWITHDRTNPEKAYDGTGIIVGGEKWPLPNVWLGVSVENQAAADERIPCLLETPARVRFLSCEPLLGPVDLTRLTYRGDRLNPLDTAHDQAAPHIHWCIIGGESGPGSRPFHLDWARSLQNQCDAAGVPVFFKQAGSAPFDWTRGDPPNHEPRELVPLRLKDRKGGDLAELPACLDVREFPATT
jgi:protein gp37